MSTLAPNARTGFSNSTAYDSHRPSYSPSVVSTLLKELRVAGVKGAKILDLAAGTGKFTEALAVREEGYDVVAVEPHKQMRGTLEGKKLRGVQAMEGGAEKIPLKDETMDAVICAQAFHWFANMDTLREIHRVLKPHGALGLVWNVDDFNAPKDHKHVTTWESQVNDITWSTTDTSPRYRHLQWRKVFDQQSKSTPLSLIIANNDQLFSLPLGEYSEPFEVCLTKEAWWERYNTISHIANLEGEEKEKTFKRFMEILGGKDVEVDGDGRVMGHGETVVVWTSKIPGDGREGLGDTVETP